MSDLYIMFNETYDAPLQERNDRLIAIAAHFKVRWIKVVVAYFEYIDSDAFYAERGI
jgi:hypothetical protein